MAKQRWKSKKPSQYAAVLLGQLLASTGVIAAGALAAGAPAFAAGTAGPPRVQSHAPGLRIGPDLSVLPIAGRRALAPATKSKELFGVFCNSPSDCWAVGSIRGKTVAVNQVLHWTGKKWFTVAVPNQAGIIKGADNELFAVRCTSDLNCWAIGDSQQPGSAELDQALHFNGKKWSLEDTPSPGGTTQGDINTLNDVACTSAVSCWAVGDYGMQGMSAEPEILFNQALHWDGHKWLFVKTPTRPVTPWATPTRWTASAAPR